MIKKIKKIEKWLLLILISFCVVFTVINVDGMGLGKAISFKLDEDKIANMNLEEIKQISSDCEESIKIQTEEIKNDNESNYGKAFQEYPVGTYMLIKEFSQIKSYSDNLIVSLILGILIGTGIFFVIDEDKKGIKLLVLFYILSIFLLGFLEGIYIKSESILDKWLFPVTYIIPATLMYGVVLVFIKIKQQNLAIELNKKLQEEKKKEEIDIENSEEREETFLERTRETREKMAKIGSVIIEIIMILIIFIYLICA